MIKLAAAEIFARSGSVHAKTYGCLQRLLQWRYISPEVKES